MKLIRIFFLTLALGSATLAFSEEGKKTVREGPAFEKLQLKNADVIKLSPEDAAEMNRQALATSAEMIEKSDDETKAALEKAAEKLHLKLPTRVTKRNQATVDSKSEEQHPIGKN